MIIPIRSLAEAVFEVPQLLDAPSCGCTPRRVQVDLPDRLIEIPQNTLLPCDCFGVLW